MYILEEYMTYEFDRILGIYDTREQAEAEFEAAILNDMANGGCEYINFRVYRVAKNRAFNEGEFEEILHSRDFGNRSDAYQYVTNVVNSGEMPRTLAEVKALSEKLDRQREEAFRAYDHEAKFEGYRGEVVWH